MEGGFVMENRLFLLYFPGYYDGDEIIGIYDDISKLKASYERVISNPADEHGFQQYDFYLNNPCTKLTIEEFDQDNEIFVEVDTELLWAEFDKESVYGKGPFFLLVTADEWNHDADEWLGIYVSKRQQGKPMIGQLHGGMKSRGGCRFLHRKELRCLSILLWMTDLGKWNEKS